MKKKLSVLPLSLALATVPAAATADIQPFGILYVEMGSVEEGADATSRAYVGDENGMGRVGVRGSHKISDSLTAVGYAAWNLNVGDAAAGLTDRDHNVGLKGSFGEIRIGSFDGAYKATGGAKYDAFASTALQARGNGGMATGAFGTTSYFHNAVQYVMPALNGFNATVQYSIDERDRPGAIDNYKGAYNIGLSYDFSNYQVIAATNSVETVADGAKGNSKIGFRAKFGDFTGFLQYEDVSLMGNNVRDLDILFLGARYRLGDLLLVGQYGELSDNANSAGDQIYLAIGGRYFFDRRTSSYFGYKNTSYNEPGKSDLSTMMVALRHNF